MKIHLLCQSLNRLKTTSGKAPEPLPALGNSAALNNLLSDINSSPAFLLLLFCLLVWCFLFCLVFVVVVPVAFFSCFLCICSAARWRLSLQLGVASSSSWPRLLKLWEGSQLRSGGCSASRFLRGWARDHLAASGPC